MKTNSIILPLASFLLISGPLTAATVTSIQSVQPFSGTSSESWEDFPTGFFTDSTPGTVSILGGAGTVTGSSLAIWISGRFGPDNFGLGPFTAMTHDGFRGFGKSSSIDDVSMDFLTPITAFGGYWGIGSTTRPLGLQFFNSEGTLVGTTEFYYSRPNNDGTLEWHGWQLSEPASRVEFSGGGFFVNDALQVVSVPEPHVAILMALFCLARLGIGTRLRSH
ncbi:hypothetical protein JIN85_17590 [Luteolibacter pohnpeiensis]|uniref:PEP-CTERM protein-sorting domain-containing protein n=1 Tax=Luteolibacter pohnpeiensis TaxID=454153 RepID=A0A934S8R9_9BACT|nr:hypothetical protein [Luteolibacter pohnpeiensis]